MWTMEMLVARADEGSFTRDHDRSHLGRQAQVST
jgi:hypothetical protein